MKSQLIAIVAAVLVVGCGESQSPEPPTAKAPDISIHEAAIGNIEAVKQHIAAGTDVNAKTGDGTTPLHHAAFDGFKEIAELLIANGAEVNAMDNSRWTPLRMAAYEGHKEVVELLIVKGADVNLKASFFGETPLEMAIDLKHLEIADLLRKHGGKTGEELKAAGKPTAPVSEAASPEPPTAKAPDISIQDAAAEGNIKAIKQHIAAGTDVNAQNGGVGPAPLHRAAANGHKEIVELLIAKGAEVNFGFLRTPLDYAIGRKHIETANLLRKHGGKTGAEMRAEGK